MTLILPARRPLARRDTPARLATLGPDEFEGYASLFGVPDGAGDIARRTRFGCCISIRHWSRSASGM